MIKRSFTTALAAVSLATASAATVYAGDAENPQQLRDEVQQLRAEVEALKAQRATAPAFTARDVDATVDSVLHDAARRSVLLSEEGSPFLGGWKGGKFTLQSADGNYLLHPWFQFQPRYVYNYREDAKNGNNPDQQSGFEIRRMKFGVDGNVISPDTTYLFNWASNRKTGALELEEAWVRYRFADAMAVRLGQIKDPLSHEQLMSSKVFMAADRSLLNEVFIGGDDFVQGITLAYGDDNTPLQAEIGYTDGSQSLNTNFQDDPNDTSTPQTRPDFGVAGRVQYKLMGDWKDYQDFTAMGTKKDLLVIGAGADWTEVSGTDTYIHTADAQWESPTGLAAYGAFVGRYVHSVAGADRYDWGALAQVSYLINPKLELFGRYDYIYFSSDSQPTAAKRDVHEITAGLNYFIRGHSAKLTFDATYLPNGTPVGADSIGVLPSNGKDEVLIRGQFQLLL